MVGRIRRWILRWLRKKAYRYRAELRPLGLGLGLLVIAAAGHVLDPVHWWAAIPAGLAAGALAWHQLAERPIERQYVAAVGVVATTWTALAWRAGLTSPLLIALGLGTPVAASGWWWHRRRRSKLRLEGAWRWRLGAKRRRRLRRVLDDWEEPGTGHGAAAGLPGSALTRAVVTKHGYDLHVTLRRGEPTSTANANLDRLASTLEERPNAVRVEGDPQNERRCVIRVITDDPLAGQIPWPGPSTDSIHDKAGIALGVTADGDPVRIWLWEANVLLAGQKGSGKSIMLHLLLAALTRLRGEVALFGIDLKGGQELTPWMAALCRLETSREGATEMLGALIRLIEARGAENARRGRQHWPCTTADPAIFVVIDEFSRLDTEGLKLAGEIARTGRSVGVWLILATQNPSGKSMGDDTTLRGQMDVRIGLAVDEPGHVDVVFGQGARAEGWSTDRLAGDGRFYLRAKKRGHERPRLAKGYWMDLADVAKAVEARDPAQLDQFSAGVLQDQDGAELGEVVPFPRQPGRPALVDPLEVMLRDAPDGGLAPAELLDALKLRGAGMSFATLHRRLAALKEAGKAGKVGHGRWRAEEAASEAIE